MKIKQIHAFAAGLLALVILVSSFRLLSASAADLQSEREAYLASQCGGETLQAWLDGAVTEHAGSSAPEWQVLALSASGADCDFSAYRAAMTDLLARRPPSGATAKQRCALALIAVSDGIPGICETMLRESIGQQGIMSWVFALHLVNQGVPCAQTNAEITAELLSRQCADGGWSLPGTNGDPDVTAMTVQALAPYRDVPEVSAAIGRAMTFLSGSQLADGGFSSYGAENPESTAQVWIALNTLGLDPLTDARFVKSGHTLADAVALFSRGAGQYAHAADGDVNAAASLQVFLAYTSQQCMQAGRSLYLLRGTPVWAGQAQTDAPVQTTASPANTTKTAQSTTVQTGSQANAISTENSVSAQISDITSAQSQTQTAQTETTVTLTGSAEQTTAERRTESGTETATETTSTAVRTVQTTVTQTAQTTGTQYPYRLPLTAAVAAICLVLAVIFRCRKKRAAKTYLTLAGIGGVLIALIWVIRIETPAQYYTEQSRGGGGTVTMEIRCDVILGMPGSERFPADGVILPETEFAIDENENALTLLYDAVRANSLQIEVDGVSGEVVETAYVRGIASLYEFDFGDLSGWTYLVNGERPSVGCGAFTLHDGDCVVWAYTVSL